MYSKRYKTFWRRAVAAIIDFIILIALMVIIAYPITSVSTMPHIEKVILGGTILNIAFYTYSVLMHTIWGATLGKMAMGLQLMDISEQRLPTLFQAFIRDSVYIIASLIFIGVCWYYIFIDHPEIQAKATPTKIITDWIRNGWLILEFITMLFNEKRRALHDLMSKTVVVRKKYRTSRGS